LLFDATIRWLIFDLWSYDKGIMLITIFT